MTKEEVEVAIKRTEIDIELTKQFIEFNKREDKRIIFVSILAFIAVALINIEGGNSNFASMLSISIFTTSVYSMIEKTVSQKRDNKLKLEKLEHDLKYYKYILDNKQEEF
jgi:hypothetical protein